MEIYFVFFFPPQKKRKKPHPHCTHWQSPTSQRSNQSFAKECNLADTHGAKMKLYLYF
jgi:hypothetical protein